MTDLIKMMEDKHIKYAKEELMEKQSVELAHSTELIMRVSFAEGARMFRELGRNEGRESQKRRVIEALGLIEEEEAN